MAFTEDTRMRLYSGGWDDNDALRGTANMTGTNPTRTTTGAQTGSGAVDFDMTSNGNKAIAIASGISWNTLGTVGIWAFSGSLLLDVAPSSAASVISSNASGVGTQGSDGPLRIKTDRTLGVYDKNDNLLASSTSVVPTAGTPLEFCFIINFATVAEAWVILYCGDAAPEIDETTGLTMANFVTTTSTPLWGEWLDSGTNRGCHIYMDDLCVRASLSVNDAPHLTAYPRIRVSEPVNPTTIGNYNAWDSCTGNTIDSTSSDPTYIDNGELPQNDGDTSTLQASVASEQFTAKSTDANPIPSGATIIKVQQMAVCRNNVSKLIGSFIHRLSGSDTTTSFVSQPSTSHVGVYNSNVSRPGGGSWAQGDFASSTLEWGFQADGTSPGGRVTLMLGPEAAYYEDTFPLSTTPVLGGATRRRLGQVV